MQLKNLLTGVVAALALTSVAQGQQVTLNQQDFGICSGAPLSSYSHWLAVAGGAGCRPSVPSDLSSFISGASSSGTLDWTFLEGPVPFNGLYVTGYGTFSLDLMDGETVLHTSTFTVYGHDVFVSPEGFAGSVTRIRIRRQSGIGAFGLGERGFGAPPGDQSGGSNPGNGPSGNGPPGGSPGGDPSGGGNPPGGGPPGNGPPDNGPPGPPDDTGPSDTDGPFDDQGLPPGGDDEVNDLVNEPNATPEPVTLLLVASGLGGVGALTRLRRQSARKNKDA